MKRILIFSMILGLVGCTTPVVQTAPTSMDESSHISEVEKYKAEYQRQILRAWDVPLASEGTTARVKAYLDDHGKLEQLIFLDEVNQQFKISIEKAIKDASPFALPSNPDVRRQARKLNIRFKAT